MYIAGLAGLSLPATRHLFIALTPFNLLTTGVLVVLAHEQPTRKFWLFCIAIILAGYGIEWLGVHTGKIFGQYQYLTALGPKLDEIPPLIGLNWLILTYSVGQVLQKYRANIVILSLGGATLMVFLDLLIEQVAPTLSFWVFSGGTPGLHNYLGWYIAAFLFLLLFNTMFKNTGNILTKWVLILQFAFFVILCLVLPYTK